MTAANTLLALNIVTTALQQVLPAIVQIKAAVDSGKDMTEDQLVGLFTADDLAKAKLDSDIKAAGG